MDYLYHFVPEDMRGSILYPLNELKDKFSDRYDREVKKYNGRKRVMSLQIPKLMYRWNDVLHLSAVPPERIKQAPIRAGRPKDFFWNVYQIDARTLNPQKTIVYLYKDLSPGNQISDAEYVPFDVHSIKKYAVFRRVVERYYKDTIARGERPLLFHGISHILYKGSIDISHSRSITI